MLKSVLSPHSTEHAILQFSNQVFNSFNEKQFTLGVFIDFSKVFNKRYHKIRIKKIGKIWNKPSKH